MPMATARCCQVQRSSPLAVGGFAPASGNGQLGAPPMSHLPPATGFAPALGNSQFGALPMLQVQPKGRMQQQDLLQQILERLTEMEKEQRQQASQVTGEHWARPMLFSIESMLQDVQQRMERLETEGMHRVFSIEPGTDKVLESDAEAAEKLPTSRTNGTETRPPQSKLTNNFTFIDSQICSDEHKHAGLMDKATAAYNENGFVGIAQFVVARSLFEATCALAIFLNSITIGVEIDWALRHPNAERDPAFEVLNVSFIVVFTFEVILRLIASGLYYLSISNPDSGWNIFDVVLVLSSLAEEALGGLANVNITALRIIRTLRLARSLRIIRVLKVFKDLRIMMTGIMHSLQSLIWAGLLLLTIMYVVAICVLQFAEEEVARRQKDPTGSLLSDEDFSKLKLYYGDLPNTIYSLFRAISGGVDWNDTAEPLFAMNSGVGTLFVVYVAFSFLCVLNIVTGVLVSNAQNMVSQDDEIVFAEQMKERKKWLDDVQRIFDAADTDHTGFLDRPKFAEKMKDVQLQGWLRKIGIHVDSFTINGLFDLLDVDGDGYLDLDEFVISASTMQGMARAMDVAKIHKDTKTLRKDLALVLKLLGQHSHGTPRNI
eukprot:TRINITY_DN14707_c0_g2_i1.p1 TRINITY_DN14707_c0_g2~~TRINITY_DN14707_c0_g2_i1.p1  ORF type:complete len:602 (-),score=114.83 TRINITY_DN14707_c0_g2_i1:289-2094(-)